MVINKLRKFVLKLDFFVGIILFLIFFQFLVSLSTLLFHDFKIMLFTSAVGSIFLAILCVKDLNFKVEMSFDKILLIVSITMASLWAFIYRLNYHVFDIFCPTSTIGMVTQVARGRFPVSFITFPEFLANYHQGFIIYSGALSYLFSIEEYTAIRMTSISLYTLLILYFQLVTLFFNRNYLFLIIAAMILSVSSFPTFLMLSNNFSFFSFLAKYATVNQGWWEYLTFFEYLTAKSWALGSLVFITLSIYLLKELREDERGRWKYKLILFLLLLSSSTENPTIFSLLVLGFGLYNSHLFVLRYLKYGPKKYWIWWDFTFSIVLLLIAQMITHYIPTAFLKGENYVSLSLKFRLFELPVAAFFSRGGEVFKFLQINGPFPFLGLLLAYRNLKNWRVVSFQLFFSWILVVSFVFPIFIQLFPTSSWDGIHKFSVMNNLLTIVLLITMAPLENLKPFFYQKTMWALVLCFIICFPTNYEMFNTRLTPTIVDRSKIENPRYTDIVQFLKKNYREDVLLYPLGSGGMCSDFADIAGLSGQFARNTIYQDFLYSWEIKERYADKVHGNDLNDLENYIEDKTNVQFILVRNDERSLYRNMLSDLSRSAQASSKIKLQIRAGIEFEKYTLYPIIRN